MLNEILELQIITTPGMSIEECQHLIQKLECANLAKESLIEGNLSLEDYCDILGLCEVNVDEYLINIEDNLTVAGMI
jgi:hypothetical protein